jgi:hypothetical protein
VKTLTIGGHPIWWVGDSLTEISGRDSAGHLGESSRSELVFDFGRVSVRKEDIQENADHITNNYPGGPASDKGLNSPESKPIPERERYREASRAKNQSYQ